MAGVMHYYITNAKLPVRLVVRNVEKENTPEGYYLELAGLGWGRIQDILDIRDETLDLYGYGDPDGEKEETVGIYRTLSDGAKAAVRDLQKTRFHAVDYKLYARKLRIAIMVKKNSLLKLQG